MLDVKSPLVETYFAKLSETHAEESLVLSLRIEKEWIVHYFSYLLL